MYNFQRTFHVLNTIIFIIAVVVVVSCVDLSMELIYQVILIGFYTSVNFTIINKLAYWTNAILPIGLFYVFGFFSYFIKYLINIVDKSAFFPDWVTINSPMYYAPSSSWDLAFLLYILSNICFFIGALIAKEFCATTPKESAVISIDNAEIKRRLLFLLTLGFIIVIARYVVVYELEIGLSYGGRDAMVAGLPFLAGILQFSTLWGAYLVIGSAFALSLTYNSRQFAILVYVETLCFGITSMIGSGSKSELIRLLCIFMIILIYQKHISEKKMLKFSLYIIATISFAILIFYPLLHDYRYLIGKTTFFDYYSEQQAIRGVNLKDGLLQIILRLSGIEYLVAIIEFGQSGGIFPPISLDYSKFFTYEVMNVPYSSIMGISMSFWGGLYLIGKEMLLLGGSVLFGFGTQRFFPRNDFSRDNYEIRASFVACINLLLVSFLLFSGNLLFDVKQLISILALFWLLNKFMPRFVRQLS